MDRARVRAAIDAIEQETLADEAARVSVRELWAKWEPVYRHRLQDFRTEEKRAEHVLSKLGDLKAERITVTDIANYRNSRRQEVTVRGHRDVAPSTRNREVGLLKRWLNFGVREGIIYRNPVIHEEAEPERPPKQTKVESEEKLAKLLEHASAMQAALILLYFDCGLRRLEAMRLRWDEVQGGRLHLMHTKNREARRPKLTPRAQAALDLLPRHGEWVFANPNTGKPYDPGYLAKGFGKLVARAGLVGVGGERVTLHTIRHGFAYRGRRILKIPEKTLMKMGGWKTRAAFDRYGIVDEEEAEEGWEILALSTMQGSVRKSPVRKSIDRKAPQRSQSKHSGDGRPADTSRIADER